MVQRMHHGPGTSEDEENSLALGKPTEDIKQERSVKHTAKGHTERKAGRQIPGVAGHRTEQAVHD